MRPLRLVIAGILVLLGLGWIGQGLGFLPGSLMSGNAFWAVVGAVLLIVGIVIAARELRRG
jgi:hypothetical protein